MATVVLTVVPGENFVPPKEDVRQSIEKFLRALWEATTGDYPHKTPTATEVLDEIRRQRSEWTAEEGSSAQLDEIAEMVGEMLGLD